jgi:hypothetical protein
MAKGIDAACTNLKDSVRRATDAILGEADRLEHRSKAERKVIEAAEALLVDGLPLQLRVDRIVEAVRAMQAGRSDG